MPYRRQLLVPSNILATGINYADPLANGLVFCAVPMGRGFKDLVSGQFAPPPATCSQRVRSAVGGQAIANTHNIGGGGFNVYTFPSATGADKIAGPFTVFAEASLEVNGSTSRVIQSGENITGNGFEFNMDDGAAVLNGFYWLINNGSFAGFSNTDAVGSNSELNSFRVMAVSDGANFYAYSQGLLNLTAANVQIPTADTTRRTWINSTRTGGGQTGSVAVVAVWNRALRLKDYQTLYKNPMVLFAPVSRRRIISQVAAAAAGTTIVQLERKIRGLNRGLVRGMS